MNEIEEGEEEMIEEYGEEEMFEEQEEMSEEQNEGGEKEGEKSAAVEEAKKEESTEAAPKAEPEKTAEPAAPLTIQDKMILEINKQINLKQQELSNHADKIKDLNEIPLKDIPEVIKNVEDAQKHQIQQQ